MLGPRKRSLDREIPCHPPYSSSSSSCSSSYSCFSSASPSSSSSSVRGGSYRRLLVLLVLVFVLPEVVEMRRWMSPCGGSTTIEDSATATGTETLSTLRQAFHRLSEKSSGLKRRVRDLKQLYVTHRFRDAQLVEDMERIGLQIDGLPVLEETTAASIATIEASPTIHRAFQHLAIVSVFLDQARIGETLSDTERVSFETSIQNLENNAENGLYWLLCELHRLIIETGQQVNSDVIRSILGIRVVEVDSTSMRHTRDYLVLRNLERILEQLSVDFASLHLQTAASRR